MLWEELPGSCSSSTPIAGSARHRYGRNPQRSLDACWGKPSRRSRRWPWAPGPAADRSRSARTTSLGWSRKRSIWASTSSTRPGATEKAEEGIGKGLASQRHQLFLTTKVWADDADEARRSLEESLRTLRTEHVDLVYLHSVGNRDIEKVLSDGRRLWSTCCGRKKRARFASWASRDTPWWRHSCRFWKPVRSTSS